MRVGLLLVVLVVIVGALLAGFGVVSLDGGSPSRDGVGADDDGGLRATDAELDEGSRLVGRPGEDPRGRRPAPGIGDPASAAEAIPSRAQGETPNGARLTGRVVEGEGQIPVAGALVRLGVSNSLYAYLRAERRGRFDELGARTDEEGRFAFYDVTPAKGYVVRARAGDRPAVSAVGLDLRGRPAKDLGDLVLREPAVLTGRVIDGRGEGIEDARVAVTWLVENPMMIVLADPDTLPETEREVRTDAEGAFRVEALEPGVKTIVIDAGERGQAAIRSHGVGDEDVTTLPDVVLAGEGVLAGRVQADDGSPIADARVFAGVDNDPAVRTVHADADGGWRLENLPAGTFTVGVLVPGLPLQLEQGIEAGREDVVTEFPTSGSVAGRVVVEATGAPVAAFRVQLERTEPSGDWMMQYMQKIIDEVIGPLPVRNADGLFELTPVPPGAYRVRVEAEGFPAAVSDVLQVESGKRASVSIRMPQGHGLLGEVQGDGGAPVAGVRVYVAPAAVVEAVEARLNPSLLEDWAEDERVAAFSDGEGRFDLPPQTPGVYYLLLIHDEYQPTLIADVDLQREATARMPMRLESAGRLKGRLLGPGGEGYANQPVLLVYPSGAVYELETDREGGFERRALPPGEALGLWYAIPLHPKVRALRSAADEEARAKAYEALRSVGASPLVILPGRAVEVTLGTGPLARVEGTLRVDGGPPTASAMVWITNREGGRGEPAEVDADGRFEVDLPLGTYTFWARGADDSWSATQVVVKDATGQRVDLER